MLISDIKAVSPPATFTINDLIATNAEIHSDKIAYIYLRDGEEDEDKITFKELYYSSLKIANQLAELNAIHQRVILLFPPGMEFIKAIYGCFLAGAIAVPAYPPRKNRSIERIKTIVVDSGADFVLSTSEIFIATERSFSDFTELKHLKWLITDESSGTSHLSLLNPVMPDDIALLQYTSGSTGNPKGVMVTHNNLINNLEFLKQAFDVCSETISISWLPTFHDMGLIEGMMGAEYNGYTSILMPPVAFIQKPARWVMAFNKYRGTHGGAPNFAFDLLVDNVSDNERQGLDLSCIHTIYCGAEPIRKSTFDRFIETYSNYGMQLQSLYPTYGMAETTLIIAGGDHKGPYYLYVSASALEQNKIIKVSETSHDAKALVGVGHPWIDTEIRIVNPETFCLSAPDEIGEIWISGSIVTAGYWNKKEITHETFRAVIKDDNFTGKHWLRTGDLGFILDNNLFITGRLKDLIILYGKNYYPQDFEFIAENSHEAIKPASSAAFSIEVDNIEKLVFICEIKRTYIRDLDVDNVCTAIRTSIANEFEQQVYAIQLLRTASIPKTSSGKIQHRICKQAFLNKTLDVIGESFHTDLTLETTTESSSTKPVTEVSSIEAWLIVWVCSNLHVPFENIDVLKPIASYGLSSIKAIQLQNDFLKKFHVNIPPYLFFEKMTLKDLSSRAFERLEKNCSMQL